MHGAVITSVDSGEAADGQLGQEDGLLGEAEQLAAGKRALSLEHRPPLVHQQPCVHRVLL